MVLPFSKSPDEKKPKTIGVDANLARHLNFIFAPGNPIGERVKQWVTKHPTTGRPVIKKIAVQGKLGLSELRTFLILCKLRQESSSSDVQFSLQQTAKYALLEWHGKGGANTKRTRQSAKSGGKSTGDSLRDALMHLRFSGLILTNLYLDPEKGEFQTAEGVTILDKLRVVQHTPVDEQTGELDRPAATIQSLFRFNPMIEKAISGGVLKPIVLDALLSIDKRATAAVYAYLYLDRKLYKRNHWIEPSAVLLPAIGLAGKNKYPAERKRVLDTIAKHLDGLAISTGYLRVSVTKRKGDWCISASKLAKHPTTGHPRRLPAVALEVEGDRSTGGMRAHFEQHRSTVHPEPGDYPECETCKGCLALSRLNILKRTPTPEQPAPLDTEPTPSPTPAAPPTASLEDVDLDAHMRGSDLPITRTNGIHGTDSSSAAVAPAAQESSDTTPSARPPGVAPGEVPAA